MNHYREYAPPIKVRFQNRRFEIKLYAEGYQAVEVKKEGKLRTFHTLGFRGGSLSRHFDDIVKALKQDEF